MNTGRHIAEPRNSVSLRLETVITNGLTGDTEKLRERQQGLSPAQTILHQKILESNPPG